MSLIFVNLRWNDPGPDRYAEIVRAIPQDGDLPRGCLNRQLRRQGGALMATEAWDSEESGGPMDDLVTAMRSAGIEDSPQTAMFSVPAMFAVAFSRPAPAPTDDAAVRPAVPEQRSASTLEDVHQRAAVASAGVGA